MLKAKQNKTFSQFLQKENIEKFKRKYGTPSHILFPDAFSENISKFESVLENAEIKYKIFYAHKSNKTHVFLDNCKQKNIGVDVASLGELQNAITKNIENIEASGPKNKVFLEACIKNKVPIAVDSFSELESIIHIHSEKSISEKVNILIRISGFSHSHISRFGIEITKTKEIIEFLVKHKDKLIFLGCSFHIDTESIEEKVFAIEEIFELYREFGKHNLQAKVLNIGGGFGISYLENETDWKNYKNLLKEELINPELTMSWKKQSYGFRQSGNAVIGEGKIYTPFKEQTGAGYLQKVLESTLKNFNNMKVREYLQENFLTLWIEPGRSFHDGTALSLTSVISVKHIGGEILVTLDTNSFQLGAREQELFSDPILFSSTGTTSKKGVFLTGNLCLESDFISKHKVFLGKIPEVGDILAFVNTGGYLMDFYETTSISHTLPQKIIYHSENNHYAL